MTSAKRAEELYRKAVNDVLAARRGQLEMTSCPQPAPIPAWAEEIELDPEWADLLRV